MTSWLPDRETVVYLSEVWLTEDCCGPVNVLAWWDKNDRGVLTCYAVMTNLRATWQTYRIGSRRMWIETMFRDWQSGHELEALIQEVNARITDGSNSHITVRQQGGRTRWTLPYPRSSEAVNHPIFDEIPQVDLSRVLAFADEGCQMLDAFSHVLGRYSEAGISPTVLRASVVAWGTNMGLGRMGSISDISAHVLARASQNYLSPETLKVANDRASNAIAALPITAVYNLGGQRHSSSDGQKFEMAIDTHGTNQVNFALLHVFGFQFAPRYRNIPEKVEKGLYGFQHHRTAEE